MKFVLWATLLMSPMTAVAAVQTSSAVAILTPEASGSLRLCSGVLVGPRWVLTAAHCLPRTPVEIQDTLVTTLSSVDFIQSAQDRTAALALLASSESDTTAIVSAWSDGDPTALENRGDSHWELVERDVALLELKRELPAGVPADLGCLKLRAGQSMSATHVGYSTFDSRATELRLFASQKYNYFFAKADLARGDSGGPVLIERDGRTQVVALASGVDQMGSADFAPITPKTLQRIEKGTGHHFECR